MAQQNPAEHYLGTWKAVTDAQEKVPPLQISWSNEFIKIKQDTLSQTSAYTLECASDSCILNLVGEQISTGRFAITPIDRNAFYFNTLKNHRLYLAGKHAAPGAIAWGWSDTRPIKFVRQSNNPDL